MTSSSLVWAQQSLRSSSFIQAIDAATSVYIASQEWKDYLVSFNIVFPVPSCTTTSANDFPATLDLLKNGTTRVPVLNLCYEHNALHPWPLIHQKAGQLLVSTLKNQYKIQDLVANFTTVNTTLLGYFNSLKAAVDSGECDVIIASTNWDNSRLSQAHFQCAYGTSFNGYLRSALDADTIKVTSVNDLNQPGVKVAVYKATTYDQYATANLAKAEIVRFSGGYYEAWPMILNNQVHAMITDAADLFSWLAANKANCSSCKVDVFGNQFSFGSFTTSKIVKSLGSSVVINFTYIFLLMMSAIMFMC
ncbi:hypothetical protein C9374_008029 [Naegleria lovaniensis]|uniref:Solute-binding protein family 3/N-terminal domain-containing protein n=1 Tax=Naegleria lovaniensis TaxID=51637 RepID=A0AA88KI50_NAELO|nr:uncharacterized protein C9374_008029 [Naegleria lovaniensis]KAG2378881.1 hypothetical protein C9374_008029 [Naegleria lovaniensis]